MGYESIEQIREEIEYRHSVSELKRKSGLRLTRGWVGTIVDYVLLLVPFVAPIPNLVNLQVALTPVLSFWGAMVAAISLELLLFGSAETILFLQDKQMRNKGYETALKISIWCGIGLVGILLSLIAAYEVPRYGLAVLTLPFVSVISIAFLSLKRWADIKDSIEIDNKNSGTESMENHDMESGNSNVESMWNPAQKSRRKKVELHLLEKWNGAERDGIVIGRIAKEFGKDPKTIKGDINAIWQANGWNGKVGEN